MRRGSDQHLLFIFQLFSSRKNFQDAGAFCNANNWTLAADKSSKTHDALLRVMAGEAIAYIGKKQWFITSAARVLFL